MRDNYEGLCAAMTSVSASAFFGKHSEDGSSSWLAIEMSPTEVWLLLSNVNLTYTYLYAVGVLTV